MSTITIHGVNGPVSIPYAPPLPTAPTAPNAPIGSPSVVSVGTTTPIGSPSVVSVGTTSSSSNLLTDTQRLAIYAALVVLLFIGVFSLIVPVSDVVDAGKEAAKGAAEGALL